MCRVPSELMVEICEFDLQLPRVADLRGYDLNHAFASCFHADP